jgi:DNA-directed RNA polymerase sigma subunit (sigma70/sigma32)
MSTAVDPEVQREHEDHLRKIEEAKRGLEGILGWYRDERNEAIRKAVDAGLTPAQVARATSLSRERVRQILEEK